MAATVQDIMTSNPVTVTDATTLSDAAMRMRDADIGNVIVLSDGKPCGIVTDRDIVVRGIAEHRNPDSTPIADVCSRDFVSVNADTKLDDAVKLMREKSLRRLPVMDGTKPIGIVSIGDLAIEKDQRSALADISAAPPNR